MVAISHSPYSEKLIRATRRLAYNLEAPWVAVHVNTGLVLNNADQLQLAKNLALARELKGEIITTTEVNVPVALRRIARQKNVTQIIVGRPARRWFRDRLEGGSLLDRLVRESMEIDVHVISREESSTAHAVPQSILGQIRLAAAPMHYWFTFCLLAGVSIVGVFLDPFVGYRAIGFIYLLAVMIIGSLASIGPVFVAACLSSLVWNYLFIPPRFTFIIRDPNDAIMCVAFFVTASIMGFLTNRIQLSERILREREERTNVLYEVLQDISSSKSAAEFLTKIVNRVGKILKARCGVCITGDNDRLDFDFNKPYSLSLTLKSQAVASWAFESEKVAGWSTETLSDARALYIPLRGTAKALGVFVFNPKSKRRLNLEEETLLYSICRQLGVALERYAVEKRLKATYRFEESEKLHQTLLNSISHEMRTPLTVILGTASALDESASHVDAEFVKVAATNLLEAGDRLNRVIENLLDMSRLNSGVLELKVDWHDITDLVGVVLGKLGKNLIGHPVTTQIADSLPMLKIDFRFMEHALSNLIMNAVTYAPAGTSIEISAVSNGKFLDISVEDEGQGIPILERERVFDKFYRLPGTPSGGTGLGLSIVKSIIAAHGGNVRVESGKSGGAKFVMSLPQKETLPFVPEGRVQ